VQDTITFITNHKLGTHIIYDDFIGAKIYSLVLPWRLNQGF